MLWLLTCFKVLTLETKKRWAHETEPYGRKTTSWGSPGPLARTSQGPLGTLPVHPGDSPGPPRDALRPPGAPGDIPGSPEDPAGISWDPQGPPWTILSCYVSNHGSLVCQTMVPLRVYYGSIIVYCGLYGSRAKLSNCSTGHQITRYKISVSPNKKHTPEASCPIEQGWCKALS